MYCARCGAEWLSGVAYCARCGANFGGMEIGRVARGAAALETQSELVGPQLSRRTRISVTIFLCKASMRRRYAETACIVLRKQNAEARAPRLQLASPSRARGLDNGCE